MGCASRHAGAARPGGRRLPAAVNQVVEATDHVRAFARHARGPDREIAIAPGLRGLALDRPDSRLSVLAPASVAKSARTAAIARPTPVARLAAVQTREFLQSHTLCLETKDDALKLVTPLGLAIELVEAHGSDLDFMLGDGTAH